MPRASVGLCHCQCVTSEVARRIRSLTFPELRAHQAAALAVFEDNRGASRFHFVLPPGAGKTLLGSVIAHHV